jgi:hypothetical protein
MEKAQKYAFFGPLKKAHGNKTSFAVLRFHILFGSLAIPFKHPGGSLALRPRITSGLPLSKIAICSRPPSLAFFHSC